ncbi:helix-turn-helix domain-containing protein [Nocardioides speluncae]|uniref:helix-turn-helix domain-containing protein n=1 Tax=Nocardioides speluncae TaxID=2670337 RepID=UPI000D69AB64|nr:helix-turn-helix transcriptional regulator [Nocardioides speluncae]
MTATATESAGTLLRDWRQRRNVSQLDLALRAGVSARHVSFIETGRSQPTSTMLLRLADNLDLPLREQNRLLLAGGYAPAHPEHRLADPPMAQVSAAITAILTAHLPFPALVIDQGWDLVDANDAVYAMLDGVAPELVEPPINVIRLSLHQDGLAPRIANLTEWRNHLIHRLRKEHDVSADPRLAELIEEFGHETKPSEASPELVVPLRLQAGAATLSFLSTTTVFGTPREVTLSELAIEAFYPADQETRDLLVR